MPAFAALAKATYPSSMFDNLTARALPSLNALRAFEAMARNGGATAAAAELCVTHSAVSRQVKALEGALGVRLFEGPRHALTLTPVGRGLLATLGPAFDAIAAGVAEARGQGRDLTLAVHPSLSVKWLIPRLPAFIGARPDIRLHLVELSQAAMSHRGADAVLRIVDGEQLDDPHVSTFMLNAAGPVIAPALLDGTMAETARIRTLSVPRLTIRGYPQGWTNWAALQGLDLPPADERAMAHLHFAADAAVNGWGAAVLPWPLVATEILAGRLVAPFGFRPDGGAFVLIRASGTGGSSALMALDRWLEGEGRAMPPAPSPHEGFART